MSMSFMNECNSGIWFKEEDPTDEAYNPKCCRNVYLDHAIGEFDIIKIIKIEDPYENYKDILDIYEDYLGSNDEFAYDGDCEM